MGILGRFGFVKCIYIALSVIIFNGITTPTVKAQSNGEDCPYAGRKLNKEELKPILKAHATWFMGTTNLYAKKAILCDTDLSRTDLSNVNLRNANLRNVDLREANLSGAIMSGADLQHADIRNANLEKADLRGANLDGASLYLSYLYGAKLSGASLKNTNLTFAYLKSATLYNATLQQAILIGAELQDADLTGANLTNAVLTKARLQNANLVSANLQNAKLYEADLEGSDLSKANLRWATLSNANMKKTILSGATLQYSDLRGSILQEATLESSNLKGALLINADLRKANLQDSSLTNASFANAKMRGTSLLGVPYDDLKLFEGLTGTEQYPEGVFSVREKFKNSGERRAERYLTYIIKRNERLKLNPDNEFFHINFIESTFSFVFFEFPSAWGKESGRPLLILLGLIAVFSFVYTVPIYKKVKDTKKSGLYQILPIERLVIKSSHSGEMELAKAAEVSRFHRQGILIAFWHAFYFSVLSAFHIGWRDFNVGNWITRLQPTETILRPRGWVRVISGIQSLLSVYLLALWALVYFGRPFG